MRKNELFTFDSWPVGTPERLIHGYWQLDMMRFHAFVSECSKEYQDSYNRINHKLGASVAYINLASVGEDYRYKSEVLDVIRSDKQTWIWFTSCSALLDTSLAGWLRSVLTTYNVNHIRATFVFDNPDQFNKICQNFSAPLYKSTIALKLVKSS
ncbi:hypothetical protein BTA15_14470 [Vibrio parahaemolyticus]|nr:hypothetical protein BTA15_14470 [Vibrio parahaemolyticus]